MLLESGLASVTDLRWLWKSFLYQSCHLETLALETVVARRFAQRIRILDEVYLRYWLCIRGVRFWQLVTKVSNFLARVKESTNPPMSRSFAGFQPHLWIFCWDRRRIDHSFLILLTLKPTSVNCESVLFCLMVADTFLDRIPGLLADTISCNS